MTEKYTWWDDVPDHLKTKTQLKKLGLRPDKDQVLAGRKIGGYGPYNLYDIAHAVSRRRPSPAQLAALEKARLAGCTCRRCGITEYHHSQLVGGYCWECVEKKRHIPSRNRAIKWAQTVLVADTLILDAETTGLDDNDEVIQLVIMDLVGHVLFKSLFKPSQAICTSATEIHGIGQAALENKPLFSGCCVTIRDILTGRRIVAYNMDFDERLLTQTCKRYGLPEFEALSWDCAMRKFAAFYGDWSDYHQSYTWKSLAFAAGELGIPVVEAHEAGADCLVTLGVIKGMADSKKGKG